MPRCVRDGVTSAPACFKAETSLMPTATARMMGDGNTDAVLAAEGERLRGGQRRHRVDRVVAADGDPDRPSVADACSEGVIRARRGDGLGRAAEMVHEHSVRHDRSPWKRSRRWASFHSATWPSDGIRARLAGASAARSNL
jgi:hypothetical protein